MTCPFLSSMYDPGEVWNCVRLFLFFYTLPHRHAKHTRTHIWIYTCMRTYTRAHWLTRTLWCFWSLATSPLLSTHRRNLSRAIHHYRWVSYPRNTCLLNITRIFHKKCKNCNSYLERITNPIAASSYQHISFWCRARPRIKKHLNEIEPTCGKGDIHFSESILQERAQPSREKKKKDPTIVRRKIMFAERL